MRIAAVVFPRLTQLDLTGPYEVFSRVADAELDLVAQSLEPVRSEFGLPIVPTTTFDRAVQCDVLFVPGGPGVNDAMLDDRLVAFVRTQAAGARYVTSVCTGALILGAAGLLRDYRAATHWTAMEFLPRFGAIPVDERVVVDRNRVTSGGVTAGIDFALRVVAKLRGSEAARLIELAIEYRPMTDGDSTLVQRVKTGQVNAQEIRRAAVEKAAGKLR
ncbi:MAG TPA: DJ-1/PfpI family protein [Thermoanaerobaculia bacterium]|nr:DJ-1/PfpI family protein [Thermoanaerobaculia bacterium]